jgi:hypothetical protein
VAFSSRSRPQSAPCDPVHPGAAFGDSARYAASQALDVDVVQERDEPRFLVRPRHSAHTTKPTGRTMPGTESGARLAGRVPLG